MTRDEARDRAGVLLGTPCAAWTDGELRIIGEVVREHWRRVWARSRARLLHDLERRGRRKVAA